MAKTIIYELQNILNEAKLLGDQNRILNFIEEEYQIPVKLRHGEISIPQEDIAYKDELVNLFSTLEYILNQVKLNESDILTIVKNLSLENKEEIIDLYTKKKILFTTINGKSIYPKTLNQVDYIKAMEHNDIIFGIGPAGTGKTYLAVLYAMQALKAGRISKVVLVRPVVEAGEKLGFLPGDLKEKIDPYLIPLYDGIIEAIGSENQEKYVNKKIIEIAPLAYMRGRTLENAIIILDEAQNATKMQMKMFLTRLGFNSKMIVTGDITQIDLPRKSDSGLVDAYYRLKNIKGVKFIEFDSRDVMRHPLLFEIIKRYEEDNEN
ncbi:MAG TPA: PhoH family protein [Bacilli bacterium]|nr:PhoH family protein [Bacilli bacterium]HQO94065.1 PhoH family protein [Bacilli bacterium]HQQ39783.1 PhoH family protein [Bacilli bacterium]